MTIQTITAKRADDCQSAHHRTLRRATESQRTLLLVAKKRRGHDLDFPRLAEIIRGIAPDVSPLIVRDRLYHSFYPQALFHPTLTVCFDTLNHLTPLRGSICQNRILPKSEEYRRLERNSIPVPAWQLLDEHTSPDLSRFHGDYVVVKPDLGAKGAEVKIKRKLECDGGHLIRLELSKPAFNSRSSSNSFIQDPGRPAIASRPCLAESCLHGEWRHLGIDAPLLARKRSVAESREAAYPFHRAVVKVDSPFAMKKDVLDLGIQAHASFDDFPLLGTDIVRDATTGKLYVLEVNSCGSVWHLSSETGLSIQQDHKLDFEKQFDGLHVAAEALVEQVHRRAA